MFAPDDIVLKEIRHTMNNNSTNSNKDSNSEEINTTSITPCQTNNIYESTNESNDTTASPNNLLQNTATNSDDSLLGAVYGLLDLSLNNSTDDVESRKDRTKLKSLINNSSSSDKPQSDSDEDTHYIVLMMRTVILLWKKLVVKMNLMMDLLTIMITDESYKLQIRQSTVKINLSQTLMLSSSRR